MIGRAALVAAVIGTAACTGTASEPSSVNSPHAAENPPGSLTFGVFEGRTPCADCERIKVRLTLFEDTRTHTPTQYRLERIYVGKGDDRTVNEGTWRTTTGLPTDVDGVVVRLNPTAPADFSRYQRVGDNILLLLDDGDQPRVGDAQHSFTLSRTG